MDGERTHHDRFYPPSLDRLTGSFDRPRGHSGREHTAKWLIRRERLQLSANELTTIDSIPPSSIA
jgi:hypothetical protein